VTGSSLWTNNSASTTDFPTTWITAASDTISYTINITFQGFIQGIDYVHKKIDQGFENRDRIKQYRRSLFTDKILQPSITNKKKPHTIMIPPKRNFKGKASQRR